jgi:5-methylthioadenosine/S-adenosylhomocysteine deaminase
VSVIRNVLIWDSERVDAEYGDIAIDDAGSISSITPPNEASGDTLFDGHGRALAMPGLVNAHTHVSMTLLRGLGEELPLMEWLKTRIFPVEDRLTAAHIRSGAELAMLEMIAGGVTCFADMYFFMKEVADAVITSGMRAALCRGLPGDDQSKLDENIALAKEFNGREGRITVQLGPHAPYTVPRDALKRISKAAHEHNIGVHFHWLETKGELEMFKNEYKIAPVDYLEDAGLLDVHELLLAHSVWFPEEELHRVKRDNVTLVHCPKSNLKLGSGYAPVKEMIDADVNVALGTDGAASNNRLDIWDEMRTCALMHKGYRTDPTIASARDVLKMATVNGARGLGFKNTGLIRERYTADIAIVNLDRPQYVGCDRTNVPEFVVYAGSSRDVTATVVSGRLLYKDGEYLTLDPQEIIKTASRHRTEIIDR